MGSVGEGSDQGEWSEKWIGLGIVREGYKGEWIGLGSVREEHVGRDRYADSNPLLSHPYRIHSLTPIQTDSQSPHTFINISNRESGVERAVTSRGITRESRLPLSRCRMKPPPPATYGADGVCRRGTIIT
jgi:hypothetical protein